jgi:uncharacterized protein YjbI with pentapeptide repeats
MTEIKNIYGEVIFTSANPDDTFKESVEQAVEANVPLHRANLRGTDLRKANLPNADLSGADLDSANLRGAKIQMGNRVFVLKEEGTDETA